MHAPRDVHNACTRNNSRERAGQQQSQYIFRQARTTSLFRTLVFGSAIFFCFSHIPPRGEPAPRQPAPPPPASPTAPFSRSSAPWMAQGTRTMPLEGNPSIIAPRAWEGIFDSREQNNYKCAGCKQAYVLSRWGHQPQIHTNATREKKRATGAADGIHLKRRLVHMPKGKPTEGATRRDTWQSQRTRGTGIKKDGKPSPSQHDPRKSNSSMIAGLGCQIDEYERLSLAGIPFVLLIPRANCPSRRRSLCEFSLLHALDQSTSSDLSAIFFSACFSLYPEG